MSATPQLSAVAIEEIQHIRLLQSLEPAQLQRVAAFLIPCSFTPGTLILRREDEADCLYLILSGQVKVELREASGLIYSLVELGPGETFGERALLTGEPRTADVRAVGAVRAARLLSPDFFRLLEELPALYANLCRDLALQLGSWAQRHRREEQESRDVLTNVIGWQLLPEFGQFPGNSLWVRQLNHRLHLLADSGQHVLILGEHGTWKDLVARLIHFHASTSRPVLFLDCAAPPALHPGHNLERRRSLDRQVLELAQRTALFGQGVDPAQPGQRQRRGMLELASGGDLILRNLEALTGPVQAQLLEFLESGRYRRCGDSALLAARIRFIATSAGHFSGGSGTEPFSPELYRILGSEIVEMLPLRERKKDIPSIARSLLKPLGDKHHRQVSRLSPEAINRLVDHDWPLNTSELYQVLSRAVAVCQGEEIASEQIFLQAQPFAAGRFRLNLLELPSMERLARHPGFPRALRWSTVPLFGLILLGTLLGPATNNAANLAVWTLWWPALLLTVFFFARTWCSFCPLEAMSEFFGTSHSVVRQPSPWLRRLGPWLSIAGIALILLVEQATGMFSWAQATGLLLLALLGFTVLGDLLLGRRGWCKYLCPLGRIVSLFSRFSLLEMHSNQNVCFSRCRVDECVKEKECPMGLHPTGINNSDHCIMCLDCVRHCPHHSMQLDLRNPAWGLFNRARSGLFEASCSVILTAVVLAAKGTPLLFGYPAEIFPTRVWSSAEAAAAPAVVAGYLVASLTLCVVGRSGVRASFRAFGLACLPLAFSGLCAIYLRALASGGAQLVPLTMTALGLETWLDSARWTPELGTIGLLVPLLILAGGACSWHVLGRMRQHCSLGGLTLISLRVLLLITVAAYLRIL